MNIVNAVNIVSGYRSDSPKGYRGEPITGLSPINIATTGEYRKNRSGYGSHDSHGIYDIHDIHGIYGIHGFYRIHGISNDS